MMSKWRVTPHFKNKKRKIFTERKGVVHLHFEIKVKNKVVGSKYLRTIPSSFAIWFQKEEGPSCYKQEWSFYKGKGVSLFILKSNYKIRWLVLSTLELYPLLSQYDFRMKRDPPTYPPSLLKRLSLQDRAPLHSEIIVQTKVLEEISYFSLAPFAATLPQVIEQSLFLFILWWQQK